MAIGDSFTEGVGDHHRRLPNGVRGWADRVAEQLAKSDPGWEYANLAVRSKRLRHILSEQLEQAVELRPTLVTVYAGGNDLLDAGTDVRELMRQYETLVATLASSGARILLFTGYDIPLTPLRGLFRRRNHAYNAEVRRIGEVYGADIVDYWRMDGFEDRRMWSPDRLHLSRAGHKLLATEVLHVLGVPHSISLKERAPTLHPPLRRRWKEQRAWMRDWVLPLVHRKIRGVTLGDHLPPRWPEPVVVPAKGGLRRLIRDR